MHDFVSYLFSLLRRGLRLAVPAVILAAAILVISWAVCRKKGKPFSWKKAICWLLLLGWGVLTLFVTLLIRRDDSGFRFWNLHLFLAWHEAWNAFSLKGWLNVLLNIGLFVPLGILLPLMFRKLQKWYWMLSAGFGGSLAIELLQLATGRGMFDVDDLFTNTLGAMLGWAVVMVILTLVLRETGWKKRLLGCLSLPVAFIVAMAVIFGRYALQPYGNLPGDSLGKANLSHVQWNVSFTPEDGPITAQVYEVGRLDKIAAEAFAANFAKQVGAVFQDAYYYDDLIIFANHSTGDFLDLNQNDSTWEYKLGQEQVFDCGLDDVTEEVLRPMLEKWNIFVPENAVFSVEPDGEDMIHAIFQTEGSKLGAQKVRGRLDCAIREENGKSACYRILNGMVALTQHQEEPIYTPTEAVERLKSGHSSCGMYLTEQDFIEVTDCRLDWTADTKGFYQPIYRLTLRLSDETQMQDMVSALK